MLRSNQAVTIVVIYGATKQTVSVEEREVAEGVLLYKRDRSQLWQSRIRRVSGKWLSVSTKTSDLAESKYFALKYQRPPD